MDAAEIYWLQNKEPVLPSPTLGSEWVPLIEGAGKVHPFLHLHLTPAGDGAKQNPRKENQKKLLLARLATALESYTKWLEWEAT